MGRPTASLPDKVCNPFAHRGRLNSGTAQLNMGMGVHEAGDEYGPAKIPLLDHLPRRPDFRLRAQDPCSDLVLVLMGPSEHDPEQEPFSIFPFISIRVACGMAPSPQPVEARGFPDLDLANLDLDLS